MSPGTHPGLLFQSGHHDDGTGSLLPNHPPEVTQSLRQRALRGNVGVLFTVAVNVVGIDVVATWNTYRERRQFTGGPFVPVFVLIACFP